MRDPHSLNRSPKHTGWTPQTLSPSFTKSNRNHVEIEYPKATVPYSHKLVAEASNELG